MYYSIVEHTLRLSGLQWALLLHFWSNYKQQNTVKIECPEICCVTILRNIVASLNKGRCFHVDFVNSSKNLYWVSASHLKNYIIIILTKQTKANEA